MNLPSPQLQWTENDEIRSCRWHAENGTPPPKRVQIADDRMSTEVAYKLACEGTALLWRGDFQNAKQLLQALARRIDKKPAAKKTKVAATAAEAFHLHRQAQSQRARVLAMVLIPFEADYRIPLRRAPDVVTACTEAYGARHAFVTSLRELLASSAPMNGVKMAWTLRHWVQKSIRITACFPRTR
jgi:hypothetical protein